MPPTSYDAAFYAAQSDWSRQSAERVAPMAIEALSPKSVVDVGCGVGTWLAAFQAAGVVDIVGLDGAYVDQAHLQIPREAFRPTDLTDPIKLERKFDLAVCLEVAEHLPPARSESLVADLTSLAPAVMFSAAIPLQGGTDHTNERWQDEWVAMFKKHGYRAVDLIRPRAWNDEKIAPWYAQNIILYVSEDVSVPESDPMPWRVVHPRMWTQGLEQETGRLRSLSEVGRELPGAARRFVEARLRR